MEVCSDMVIFNLCMGTIETYHTVVLPVSAAVQVLSELVANQLTDRDAGTFKLKLEFTEEYPNKAPVVKFVTKIFHPNSMPLIWVQP